MLFEQLKLLLVTVGIFKRQGLNKMVASQPVGEEEVGRAEFNVATPIYATKLHRPTA